MNQLPSPESRTVHPLISRRVALSLMAGSALFVWPLASAQSVLAQTQNQPAQSQPAQSQSAQSQSAQSQSVQNSPVQSQAKPAAPTARYAKGENVDLAEIVSEWRDQYEDVPVYLCVCQEDVCNQTKQWPEVNP